MGGWGPPAAPRHPPDPSNKSPDNPVELMRMAMDDPLYMECWGPYLTDSFAAESQHVYVNLVIAQWHSGYEIGEIDDVLLRATASGVFASVPGRQYWEASGSFWRDNYSGRRRGGSIGCWMRRTKKR